MRFAVLLTKVVTLDFPSWNLIRGWLRRVDPIRRVARTPVMTRSHARRTTDSIRRAAHGGVLRIGLVISAWLVCGYLACATLPSCAEPVDVLRQPVEHHFVVAQRVVGMTTRTERRVPGSAVLSSLDVVVQFAEQRKHWQSERTKCGPGIVQDRA